MFIVLEGIDFSGKTTQTRKVANELNLNHTHEPYDLEPQIREFLNGAEAPNPQAMTLLFAADRMTCQERMKNVVCDRYLYSSIVYQKTKETPASWILETNKYAKTPDAVVLIDISAETAMNRKGPQPGDNYESLEKLEKTREEYLKMFKNKPPYSDIQHPHLETQMDIVDGEQNIDKVTKDILNTIK